MIVGPNNRQLTRPIEGVEMHTPPEHAIEDGGLIWIDVSEKWAAIWMGWDGRTGKQRWLTCAVVAEHESAGDSVNAMKAMGVAA